MYATFNAVVTALRDKVGSPYDTIPTEMAYYGEGGMEGWSSLCGTLNGSSLAINLCSDKATTSALVNELIGWYTQTALPSDTANQFAAQSEYLDNKMTKKLASSVSDSTLCHVSVTKCCLASGYASGSPERAERCARLAGDVASKAVELLTASANGTFKAVYGPLAEASCTSCHTIGKDYKAGNFTRGKGDCTECHGDNPHAGS